MILIRRRSVVVVALSVLVFSSTVSALSALYYAPSAFAGGEGLVIVSSDAPTVFSSRLDMDIIPLLEAIPETTAVSPEVFAFSHWEGVSFVVRGVDPDRFLGFQFGEALPAELDYPWPGCCTLTPSSDAIIGERLCERLGLEVPFTMMLVGSYGHRLQAVEVIAVYPGTLPVSQDSPLADELIVPMNIAQSISGMAADEASIIRVRTSEPAILEELLSPDRARFAMFDMSLSSTLLSIGDPVTVGVYVRNWGGSRGTTTITFLDDGVSFYSAEVSLNSSETKLVSVTHVPENDVGNTSEKHVISVLASGDFPTRTEAEVIVREPFLRLAGPQRAFVNVSFDATLLDHLSAPVEGALVTLSDSGGIIESSNSTDADGRCGLLADTEGLFLLSVSNLPPEQEGLEVIASVDHVQVVDLSSYPQEFLPSVESFWIAPEVIRESESTKGTFTVVNEGALSGTFEVQVMADGEPFQIVEVELGPLQGRTVTFGISDLEPGTHVLSVSSFSVQLSVEPWYVEDSDLVELVVRYGGESRLSSASSIPVYQAAKISEGNVAVALFAIGGVSAVLTTLAISSVFARELSESRRKLGIVRSIGASSSAIRRLVFAQALPKALAGSLVGVAVGVAATAVLMSSGAFVVFGHVLSFSADYGLVALTVAGAVGISLASALLSAQVAVRETAVSSIKGLAPEDAPGIDMEEVLGP